MADEQQHTELVKSTSNSCWFKHWLVWSTGVSVSMLRATEKKIFSFLKTSYRGWYVDIGPVVGESDKIWTISLNTESRKTPIVLLHGMGAGVGFWVLNLDSIAEHRPVYAIDLLGFGRSSRPTFAPDALAAEKQFVKSIEEWRREMNIPKMILLGHSLGGFLAASYTMSYPDRVSHLILADAWGFQVKPKEIRAPLWVRAIAYALTPMNPLFAVRAAGPYGQWVVEKTRPDILRKFDIFNEEGDQTMAQYIHQCNVQTPSGESAFHNMMEGLGWAKNPMLPRIHEMRKDKTITLLYGSRSWIDKSSWEKVKLSRIHSYVNVQVVSGAGHHIFADQPEAFNKLVNEACVFSDSFENEKSVSPESIQLDIRNPERSENVEEPVIISDELNTSKDSSSKND